MKPGFAALLFCAIQGLAFANTNEVSTSPPSTSPNNAQITTELGIGSESQTSPLLRISPDGTLLSIEGFQRTTGQNARMDLQGFRSLQWGQGMSASIAGSAYIKQAERPSIYDFSNVSVQPSLHAAFGKTSLGVGLSWQEMYVARQHFRSVPSVQLDATHSQDDGSNWSLMLDTSRNRHNKDLIDLDSLASTLLLHRHLVKPVSGVEAFDLSAHFTRERNDRGIHELSNKRMMLSASLDWKWQALEWTVNLGFQGVRYDLSAFETEAPRKDRAISLDVSCEYALSDKHALKFGYGENRNRSSSSFYDNNYRQLSLSFRSKW